MIKAGSLRLVMLLSLLQIALVQAAPLDIEPGRRIFMEGQLAGGQPMTALRAGITLTGRDAACVSCHRPSGMGSVEGNQQVPPITGNALFMEQGRVISNMDLRTGKRFNPKHPPYTSETLAKALRNGVNANGLEMTTLMPRYQFTDAELAQIEVYLRSLSVQPSTGVLPGEIRLATVITPDVEPARRQMLIELLKAKVSEKNISTMPGRGAGRRHMVSSAELLLGTERRWSLDIWELQGAPETWPQQLQDYYDKRPVFALVSGLGKTWQPVSDFCDKYQIPAWFPSVDLPPAIANSGYTIYFQQGLRLEAGILSQYLEQRASAAKSRIIQIYSSSDQALAQAVKPIISQNATVIDKPLSSLDKAAIKAALNDVRKSDKVVLWLRPDALEKLRDVPVPAGEVFISGKLAEPGLAALPAAWKKKTLVVYPYELPEKNRFSMDYFRKWMAFNEMPIQDEPLQAEVYFAVEYLAQTIAEMLDNLYRDYLLERAESLLSFSESAKSEQRIRNRHTMVPADRSLQAMARRHGLAATPGMPNASVGEDSRSTTIYPHMGLGPGQRFASKGAYVVKFAGPALDGLEAVTDWVVPDTH